MYETLHYFPSTAYSVFDPLTTEERKRLLAGLDLSAELAEQTPDPFDFWTLLNGREVAEVVAALEAAELYTAADQLAKSVKEGKASLKIR